MAACTAQPGSVLWAQSLKRQFCWSACRSAKVSSKPTGDIGQLNFAHPGRIQNGASAGQNMQLPPGGGVAALVVAGADILGGDGLIAGEGIGQGGFAHPR